MATLDNRFDKKPKEPEVTPTEPKARTPKYTPSEVYSRYRELGLYDTLKPEDKRIINVNPQYGIELLDGKLEYNDPVTTPERQAKLAEDWETRRQAELDAMKVGPKNASTGGSIGGEKNWQSVIDTMFTSIANDKFKYDPKSDPRYALAEEYAENAMKNQMAESALLSGGYGNSYAAATGQGVYNDYMQSAEANLEADAYNRYIDQRNHKLDMLSIANQFEERDYNRAYQKERDRIADERYETETAKADERYESETAWNRALIAAEFGDFTSLSALGVTTTDAETLFKSETDYARFTANLEMFNATGETKYLDGLGLSEESVHNIVSRYTAARFTEQFTTAYQYYQATGNTDMLEDMGIDVEYLKSIRDEEDFARKLEQAIMVATSIGDFRDLEKLGFDTSKIAKQWELSLTPPSYGGGGYNPRDDGDKTMSEYEDGSENYQEIASNCELMYKMYGSDGLEEILEYLKEAYDTGAIDQASYMPLYNKYRNLL